MAGNCLRARFHKAARANLNLFCLGRLSGIESTDGTRPLPAARDAGRIAVIQPGPCSTPAIRLSVSIFSGWRSAVQRNWPGRENDLEI